MISAQPTFLIIKVSKLDVDLWVAAFILEVRKSDGTDYVGSSLRNLLSAIGRHLKETRGVGLRLLDKSSCEFVKT